MRNLPDLQDSLINKLSTYKQELIQGKWGIGDLSYKMNDAQKNIAQDLRSMPFDVIYRVVECGRGFGKSFLQVILALEDCLREPANYPVYIIGPQLKQTKEIITPIFDRLTRDAPEGLIRKLKTENQFVVGNNRLVLGGFNRDYIDTLRGQRAKSIYIDEARDCEAADFIYGITDVLLYMIGHSSGNITLLTTTPKNLAHPFLTEVVPKSILQKSYFLRTIDDNPTLTDDQKALLIREGGGRDSESTRRELYCERIRSADLAIIPSFDETKHVSDDFTDQEYGNWILFGDYGGVRDKTWLGIGYYNFPEAKFCIVDEAIFNSNTSTMSMLPSFRRLEDNMPNLDFDYTLPRFIDAPGQILVDLNQEHRIQCEPPLKHEFEWSINQLEMAFRRNNILIHPRCEFLITSLKYGLFNKHRTDFERTETLGHCDAIAGLMYGWHNVDRKTCLIPIPDYDAYRTLQPRQKPDDLMQVSKAINPKTRFKR